MFNKFAAIAVFTACTIIGSVAHADVTVGVNAPRGKLKVVKKWGEFAKYLEGAIGEKVTIVPMSPGDLVSQSGEADFLLANPTQAVIVMEEAKAKPLATLNKKPGAKFAGVIIAKKGRGIKNAEDLKGKNVMSLKFKVAAGAYLFQTYHLMQKGINPHKDFASMKAGKSQDDLVLAVNAGAIDAAFIRSGILEAMEKEGKIKISDFEIVDQRTGDGLSLLHTTDLYPEWYLLSMPKANAKVVAKVRTAALDLRPVSGAAKAAKIVGFVEPVSIDGMKNVMKKLKVRPYEK